MIFPEDDMEFRLNWTHCAGHISGLDEAIQRLRTVAAEEFLADRGSVAVTLKGLSDELGQRKQEEENTLDAYIAEDVRRRRRGSAKLAGTKSRGDAGDD